MYQIIKQILAGKKRVNRLAFTLIELLVVVLIIGILAAVALPQYQKAVARSRLAVLKPTVNALYHGSQQYFLAHGEYPDDASALDIDIGGEMDAGSVEWEGEIYHWEDPSQRNFTWGYCRVFAFFQMVYCIDTNTNIGWGRYLDIGTEFCVAKNDTKNICRAEGYRSRSLTSPIFKSADLGNGYLVYFNEETSGEDDV